MTIAIAPGPGNMIESQFQPRGDGQLLFRHALHGQGEPAQRRKQYAGNLIVIRHLLVPKRAQVQQLLNQRIDSEQKS